MSKGNRGLDKAFSLLVKGRYPEAIRELEPRLPLFLENTQFYYLLGRAFLLSGDLNSTELYLKRGLRVDRSNRDLRLCLAVVYLKKHQTTKALGIWLDVVQSFPHERPARRGLALVKSGKALEAYLGPPHINRLLPAWKQGRWGRYFFYPLLFMTVMGMSYWTYPWMRKALRSDHPSSSGLSLDEEISLESIPKEEYFTFSGEYRYILTKKELEKGFSRAKKLFEDRRDNLAMYEINRIKYSNASRRVKAQVLLLEQHLRPPDIFSMASAYTYGELVADPYLYENCYILWRGKVTNIKRDETRMTFDFLVGYEDNRTLEGIVTVSFTSPISLVPGRAVELLARVVVNKNQFSLEGRTVRMILSSRE